MVSKLLSIFEYIILTNQFIIEQVEWEDICYIYFHFKSKLRGNYFWLYVVAIY